MTTSAMARGQRGLVFGLAAESYERFRPGYPDGVVERSLAHASRPVRRAIEVGAGTGKATRAFASRGVHVSALEPDPEMFAVLIRETAGMVVEPVCTSFEEYAGPPADLLYAASAWHWTAPEGRWERAARLLHPGGTLAAFGSPVRPVDPELRAAVEDAYSPAVAPDGRRPADAPADGGLAEQIETSGHFTDLEQHLFVREALMPQREFVGYLSTTSGFLCLPIEQRQGLLRKVAALLPAHVGVDVGERLLVARRR